DSAATFEKTLSALAAKISKTAAKNDSLRQRSRRVRVMWTLYAGFAYILAALLLILVTGWQSWGPMEISVVAGGPVVIYLIRMSLTTYYDYRISNTQLYLETLYKQRDATIDKLKAATKYNSTQQLLEKYATPPKPIRSDAPSSSAPKGKNQGPKKLQVQGGRTNLPPPPTANIQRPGSAGLPTAPNDFPPLPVKDSPQNQNMQLPPSPGAEFAPNAFEPAELTRQYTSWSAATFTQNHWYDRIMDALLGEDEAQPKNRLALICSQCRLVNGQAPPGVRTLEDVGRWRCAACHAWNGKEKPKEDVVAGLVQNWEEERRAQGIETGEEFKEDTDSDEQEMGQGAEVLEEMEEKIQPPARSTRSKSRGKERK
ncbi:hypothetical protein GQ43DRAFT_381205, partial [Delitschia confertaspora ATCC 74209]